MWTNARRGLHATAAASDARPGKAVNHNDWSCGICVPFHATNHNATITT